VTPCLTPIARYYKVAGFTIEIPKLFMERTAKWQKSYAKAEGADAKAKSQAAWAAFAKDASGTGPWKMSSFTPRE
ncbi:hypothetical protein E3H11_44210, partial [Bradyrhizobium brasilense]|nr:hypothetical protein [Bradyrhizobium brasilense]